MLADWPSDRGLVVIGAVDRKAGSRSSGREGAIKTATDLAGRLHRPVLWAMVPDGLSDIREWVVEQAAGAGDAVDWVAYGKELLRRLELVEAKPIPDRPRIMIRADEHRVNDEAVAALGAEPDLYQRGGVLVRVTSDAPPTSKSIRRPSGPRIEAVTTATIRERLSRCADWRKLVTRDGRLIEVPAHPPPWSVQAIHCRGNYPSVPVLDGVVDYPVFLPDGRILSTPGYDRLNGILYQPPTDLVVSVPECPTQRQAAEAAQRLLDVVSDFPFAGDADRAAWLAGVLTPVARFAFSGPAPLFLAEGNCRGVGKGLLLNVAARIVTGQGFAVCSYTNDREELRKLITSIVMQGDRMVLFDNLDGPFGAQ